MQTVNLGQVRGDSVHIMYANDLNGSGASPTYSGQKYIGVKVAKDINTGTYQWLKVVGENGENGTNGASVYIKYNISAQDSGATDTWSGQNYIGFATSTAAIAPTIGYKWSKFIPDNIVLNTQIKQVTGSSTTDIMSQKATVDLVNTKLTIPTGLETQLINGKGTPITPTATPESGSTIPFTAGGAFTELEKKAGLNSLLFHAGGTWAHVGRDYKNGLYFFTKLSGGGEIQVGSNNGANGANMGNYFMGFITRNNGHCWVYGMNSGCSWSYSYNTNVSVRTNSASIDGSVAIFRLGGF